jgi:hypothetical protein
MGFSGTALSVREIWGWDWSLASRNWPDIVWPIAKIGNCPVSVWIIVCNRVANTVRFAICCITSL